MAGKTGGEPLMTRAEKGKYSIACAIIIVLYGAVSEMDYQDAIREEQRITNVSKP